jgi:hypothetical protein
MLDEAADIGDEQGSGAKMELLRMRSFREQEKGRVLSANPAGI